MVKIGILGGSGLDDPDVLQDKREKRVTTPYGNPSDVLIEGNIAGVPCVLLARHGRKHDLMPTNVNYRANIWALKEAGCTHLVVTTACGSLKEDKHPGDLVFIDQFIDRYDPKFLTVGRLRSSGMLEMGGGILGKMADGLLLTNKRVVCFIVSTVKRTRTTKRASTFFDGSPNSPKGVCHIPMHTPFCSKTRKILADVAKELGYPFHESGTMLTIEGPRFSTKAESHLFRSWGADLINMTTVPEVVLAKEAGLCYAAIALTTDYDCWHESEEAVSTLKVLECMKNNSHKATEVIKKAIPLIAAADWTETIQANKDEVKNSTML